MTPSLRRSPMGLAALLYVLVAPPSAVGQDLADYDYENLGFRGVAAHWGHMVAPTRVEPTWTLGARMDLGYLGPGLRLTPTVSWWSSTLEAGEVDELEGRLSSLIDRETPGAPPTVDLGTIDWSDLSLGLDAHVVWDVRWGLLTFAGLGTSVHFLNGSGSAIAGTFIEDLLDTITAGFNVHGGLEYPVVDRFRLVGQARYELLEDLRYLELRVGGQVMLSPPGVGEAGR